MRNEKNYFRWSLGTQRERGDIEIEGILFWRPPSRDKGGGRERQLWSLEFL